jgi:hypothetical protein
LLAETTMISDNADFLLDNPEYRKAGNNMSVNEWI